jgi:Mrp family chromosome partitioning ATPase
MKPASVESAKYEPTVFGAVRRYRIMVIVFALAGLVAAVGYAKHGGETYAGKGSISVPPLASQGSQAIDSQVLLLESSAVDQRAATIAAAQLHNNSLPAQAFAPGGGSVTLFPPVGASVGSYGASVIGVAFTASSPRTAEVGVNALLQAFTQELSANTAADYASAIAGIDQTINGTTDPTQREGLLAQRNQQLVQEQIDLAQQPTVLWATEPTAPVSGWKRTALEGLVIGLLIGIAVAYARASRRGGSERIVDRQDPAALYGVPLIGEIPAYEAEKALRSKGTAPRDLLISAQPHSAVAEAFRFAAGALERIRAERGPRLSLVFVSPLTDVGKSMVVANLALAIAEGGTRVLAVDADAGEGELTARLLPDTPASSGLEQVLAGERELTKCIQPSPLNGAVAVLGSGPAPRRRVTGAARSRAASELLARAKSSFDIVLINSPAFLQVADATELVNAADSTIIVLSPNELIRDHLEMVDRLKLLASDIVGYIYNRAPMPPQLARYQRDGSSARLIDFREAALSTFSGGRPVNGKNGSSPEPEE